MNTWSWPLFMSLKRNKNSHQWSLQNMSRSSCKLKQNLYVSLRSMISSSLYYLISTAIQKSSSIFPVQENKWGRETLVCSSPPPCCLNGFPRAVSCLEIEKIIIEVKTGDDTNDQMRAHRRRRTVSVGEIQCSWTT